MIGCVIFECTLFDWFGAFGAHLIDPKGEGRTDGRRQEKDKYNAQRVLNGCVPEAISPKPATGIYAAGATERRVKTHGWLRRVGPFGADFQSRAASVAEKY